jgi:hypothetical protein
LLSRLASLYGPLELLDLVFEEGKIVDARYRRLAVELEPEIGRHPVAAKALEVRKPPARSAPRVL